MHAVTTRAVARRGRVLIIDDDEALTEIMRAALIAENDVAITSSARDALDWLKHGNRFDIVLCDVMMPSMDGLAFHAAVRASVPEMASRIVFITAGPPQREMRDALLSLPNLCLNKPVELEGLHALVRRRVRE